MIRFPILVLFAALSFAQTAGEPADKPPADVDQALRARIDGFYGLIVKRDYRRAEAFVAEDTKDNYYNNAKPKVLKFEISSIEYSEHFTRAKATLKCDVAIEDAAFAIRSMSFPIPSTWKLEEGEWRWYLERVEAWRTPFGVMKPTAPSVGPAEPPRISYNVAFGKVKVDKQAVTLKRGESAQVTITNTAPGTMKLAVSTLHGIDVKLDRSEVTSKEKAVLTLRAGKGAASGALLIGILPTNEAIKIDVTVQ
ncbi:MAG: hypothetical protein LAP87_03345 [Acidobacteriia bacterium]|nr:hypothetical protein [Terriglobia bacterium]